MTNSSSMPPEIRFTPEFKRNLRQLSKKYRHIKNDLDPVIVQLASGATPGDQIPGVGYTVFKVRIRNSDIDKGQRSGYRMIYYLKTKRAIILVTIYAKSEQGDIAPERIRAILGDFDHTNS